MARESFSTTFDLDKSILAIDSSQTITTFLQKLFPPPDGSIHNFLFDLDRTVENKLGNGPNEFGDVLIAMQLAPPAELLTAWFEERNDERLKADMMRVSRHLQAKLRHNKRRGRVACGLAFWVRRLQTRDKRTVKEFRNGHQKKWLTAFRQRTGRAFYRHCTY